MKRRALLFGGLAGALGLSALLRPNDKGHNHEPYFRAMSTALDNAGAAGPTLIVDRSRLEQNISTLQSHIGDRFAYRIVAKSLPSLPLLQRVMQQTGSNRLMLFHQPFVNQVAAYMPQADILLGKPMPVVAAHNFYRDFKGGRFKPGHQLRWLIDTQQRLAQYDALATHLSEPMQVCVELDIGLHRGGVENDEQLLQILEALSRSTHLHFCGFMGYEPHIVKIPVGDTLAYRDKAVARYQHFVELARGHLGDEWPAGALLNAAGSTTYQLYDHGKFPFNELAAGSCLVKPTDFDLSTLADHRPASFIATPVLKAMDTLQIPGIDLGRLQTAWNPNRERSFFTYGGYWKAKPESPRGLSTNALLGRSTNQELYNGSAGIDLQADDWVFLRPSQSEFVFLQFGDIAVYDGGHIVERWPIFSENFA